MMGPPLNSIDSNVQFTNGRQAQHVPKPIVSRDGQFELFKGMILTTGALVPEAVSPTNEV
jgi:hypothetical protein